jgi:CRISPR system Cascade subunit CasE
MAFPSEDLIDNDPMFLQPYKPEQFERPKFLFRIDNGRDRNNPRTVVLVQSEKEPNWRYAFQNASILLAANPECRSLNLSFRSGENYRFRLLANPTMKKSVRSSGKKNGPRVGLMMKEDQILWLKRKAIQHGFEFQEESIVIESQGFSQGWKGSESIKHFSARFDGILRVADTEIFTAAVRDGIGSAKSFGFGLLSVAPIHRGDAS